MADTKGGNLSRLVLKQAGRAKEKVKSNVVDMITDGRFGCNNESFDLDEVI